MKDQFFTPKNLAFAAVRAAKIRKVQIVADFAAGHGDLLAAAIDRWPSCQIFANDIDPLCARTLRKLKSIHSVSCCDFLDERSRKASKILKSLLNACDIVLLNPPFSGRGSAACIAESRAGRIRCSRAFAFVLTAFDYLKMGGELIAILPPSCLSSSKDARCRDLIMSMASMTVIKRFSKSTFMGCSASTVVVRFKKSDNSTAITPPNMTISPKIGSRTLTVRLIRGCIPVHRALNGLAGTKFPFVHSTEIVGQKITCCDRYVDLGSRLVSSPSVLITRVGSQKTAKCAIYLGRRKLALSDCVIALECDSIEVADKVRRRLCDNWETVAASYEGTCAPYITIEGLVRLLRSLDIIVAS
ncbi:MAG: N-6 DNA methylase [Planctomycetes bacterium]|nr:N-6 DNA methylase [Planctomycetota bacterium]